jgi:hypothetical protein
MPNLWPIAKSAQWTARRRSFPKISAAHDANQCRSTDGGQNFAGHKRRSFGIERVGERALTLLRW